MSKFTWYDLMTPDVKASSEFYSHVAGWTIRDSGMPGASPYYILSANGIDVGGLMSSPPSYGMPPVWTGYIHSSDVDRDAKRAAELGGSVYREAQDIPGVGRFAVLCDPSGAAFIAFKPSSTAQPAAVADGTPGHFGWRELISGNWQQAFDFYAALFGWTKTEAMDMGPMGTYQLFATGPGQTAGMMTKAPQDPYPPRWNYYINVDTMTGAVKRATERGARVVMEPMEVPGGGFACGCIDPQGAAFSLFSMTR
jgi:uncharacterized protein